MNKMKIKNRVSNPATDDSDESNQQATAGKLLDLSLLRQPIATSVTGFEEVLRAYEAGTSELRKLLSRECDLIYECKVCRNIFRSLTNFISHKRVYCRTSFNPSEHFHFRQNGFQHQNVSTIIEAEQVSNANPNGILPGVDDKSKDLSGIVERLLWKQHQSRSSNINDFYDQIQQDSTSPKSQTLKLDRVNDSDIAVYQSLQMSNDNNTSIRDEVAEVHKMMAKSNNTVLGPDGKVINLFSSTTSNGQTSPADSDSLTCQICHESFDTKKTLKLHVELKHLPSTYLYPCPSCHQTFSSSAAVIKHLSNAHNKNLRRIRMMRDNIIKKRVRADEIVKKSSTTSANREVQKLNNGNDATNDDSEKSWNTNDLSGDYQNDSYTCPSCFKKFERKTVYTNHVLACSEAKCKENTKLKKQKAKEEAKIKEAEENANTQTQEVNKRKRKKVNKAKKDTETDSVSNNVKAEEENTSVVDWNLDDEEEKEKLENIKKEVFAEEYKFADSCVTQTQQEMEPTSTSMLKMTEDHHNIKTDDDDDDDENALVIDEKAENDPESTYKCPQCEKVFDTDDKLKYHTNTFHSRQKRFKCKMCEYQGYRKKDTMNHLNYVHNIEGDKEKLESLMESVMRAMDEESLAKQSELKRNQLKIKRRMERQKKRESKLLVEGKVIEGEKAVNDEKIQQQNSVPTPMEEDSPENALKMLFEPPPLVPIQQNVHEFKEPSIISNTALPNSSVPAKLRRKSLHTSVLIPPENDVDEPGSPLKIPKMFIKAAPTSSSDESPENSEKKKKKRSTRSGGVPSDQLKPGQSLLDISKFGKVVKRSSNGDGKEGGQRPIRNRIKPVNKDFLYDLSDLLKKDADAHREQSAINSNVTYKRELRKRAMSTHTRETPSLNSFDDSSNSLSPIKIPTLSMSPIKSPRKDEDDDIPLMRIKENKQHRRMSVFQPPARPMFAGASQNVEYSRSNSTNPNTGAAYKMALKEFDANRASLYEPKFLWTICFDSDKKTAFSGSSNGTGISAASSILQRLSGKVEPPTMNYAQNREESIGLSSALPDASENSQGINLNPSQNGLIELALKSGGDVCVLQECDPDSDEDEKPSASSSDIGNVKKTSKNKRRAEEGAKSTKKSKKNMEKKKSGTNGQRRLTVMQRLQENKIRKSREQLFQKLIMDRQSNDDDDDEDDVEGDDPSSPIYNLYSES